MKERMVDPFANEDELPPDICPVCGGHINPFGMIQEENYGFLYLKQRETSIKSCMNDDCGYEIRKEL